MAKEGGHQTAKIAIIALIAAIEPWLKVASTSQPNCEEAPGPRGTGYCGRLESGQGPPTMLSESALAMRNAAVRTIVRVH